MWVDDGELQKLSRALEQALGDLRSDREKPAGPASTAAGVSHFLPGIGRCFLLTERNVIKNR